ncbi:hypothetical protein VTJ04DRAFT_7227 [Mycothermus thermophilus]|uniref:uncharacterized protein n=1 Tax=Humicola insolens TaxID=85995 RepID=UPI0037447473
MPDRPQTRQDKANHDKINSKTPPLTPLSHMIRRGKVVKRDPSTRPRWQRQHTTSPRRHVLLRKQFLSPFQATADSPIPHNADSVPSISGPPRGEDETTNPQHTIL